MTKSILTVKDLDVSVEDRTLIKDLSFQIQTGLLTCVTGENGVGKTTLIKTLINSYHNKNSAINFSINEKQIQYVPQFRNLDDEFPLMVKDFVSLSLQDSWVPWLSRSEKQRIDRVLEATNLTSIAKEPLGKASGGEKQRAFLAQALVTDPKLLILDEATASLDKDAKVELLKLVRQLIKKEDMAVIFITHDPSLLDRFGDYELNIANQQGKMIRLGGKN